MEQEESGPLRPLPLSLGPIQQLGMAGEEAPRHNQKWEGGGQFCGSWGQRAVQLRWLRRRERRETEAAEGLRTPGLLSINKVEASGAGSRPWSSVER